MSDTSEEKNEPASDKKIRDARKKGQVQRSQDLVSALVLLICSLYLLILPTRVQAEFSSMLDMAGLIHTHTFDDVAMRMGVQFFGNLAGTLLPLIALVIVAVVTGNLVAKRGLVFSTEPLKPDFNKINPAKGLERIFSFRGIIEFCMMVVKVTAVSAALSIVLYNGLGILVQAPFCGGPCMREAFLTLLIPLIATAVAAFLVLGLTDGLLQSWLFRREMRMTKTETKRESKDMQGDPLVRRERRRQQQEMSRSPRNSGLSSATVLIGAAGGHVVGIRYKRGETPVPFVVLHEGPDRSSAVVAAARASSIPIYDDARLAENLAGTSRPGNAVLERHFQQVADVLVGLRLL